MLIHCLLLLLLSIPCMSRTPLDDCFTVIRRRSLDNDQPIVEMWNVDVDECKQKCVEIVSNNASVVQSISIRCRITHIQIKCYSFIFDNRQRSCRIFEHDGNEYPAILHPANGFDYYKRVSYQEKCANPSFLGAKKAPEVKNSLEQLQNNGIEKHQMKINSHRIGTFNSRGKPISETVLKSAVTWGQWSDCLFKVRNVPVRVRVKQCDIEQCQNDQLQVRRCRVNPNI